MLCRIALRLERNYMQFEMLLGKGGAPAVPIALPLPSHLWVVSVEDVEASRSLGEPMSQAVMPALGRDAPVRASAAPTAPGSQVSSSVLPVFPGPPPTPTTWHHAYHVSRGAHPPREPPAAGVWEASLARLRRQEKYLRSEGVCYKDFPVTTAEIDLHDLVKTLSQWSEIPPPPPQAPCRAPPPPLGPPPGWVEPPGWAGLASALPASSECTRPLQAPLPLPGHGKTSPTTPAQGTPPYEDVRLSMWEGKMAPAAAPTTAAAPATAPAPLAEPPVTTAAPAASAAAIWLGPTAAAIWLGPEPGA
jgi:hypothetical protein